MRAESYFRTEREPIEDVAQDHMRDPAVEWLEPPVEASVRSWVLSYLFTGGMFSVFSSLLNQP